MKTIKTLILMLVAYSSSMAQTSSDFYKIDYEVREDTTNLKMQKLQFFFVEEGSFKFDKVFLDNCESYLKSLDEKPGEYMEEGYMFYEEKKSFNRNDDIGNEELFESHFDEIIAVLQFYKKPLGGCDRRFLLIEPGKPKRFFMNGVEKSRLRD